MNKPNFSAKEAACQWIGCSWDSLNDYRYHRGLTSTPVYCVDNTYVTTAVNGKKPPKRDSEYVSNGEGKFIEAYDSMATYCKSRGCTVWIYKGEA